MRELEGRSYAEIAEILGITVSAVETLIFRARRSLREQLDGALTCLEAERAISRRSDGKLSRQESRALRAHLRECRECERLARSQRAQRSAFKALAVVPLPTSLTSLFGGGGAAVGTGVAAKAAAVVAAGVVATGAGYKGAQEFTQPKRKPVAARPVQATRAPVREVAAPLVVAAPVVKHVAAPKPAAAAKKPVQSARSKQAAKANGRATAPGQLKKASVAASVSHVKPHKARPAKKPKPARSHAPSAKPIPPGQAKKQAESAVPPVPKEHGKPPKP